MEIHVVKAVDGNLSVLHHLFLPHFFFCFLRQESSWGRQQCSAACSEPVLLQEEQICFTDMKSYTA